MACPGGHHSGPCRYHKACHQLYGKHYVFDTAGSVEEALPYPQHHQLLSSLPWEVPQLMQAKHDLNTTKDKLDNLDIKVWGKHTYFTNRAGSVVNFLRDQYSPEMCTIAWAKMYEMIIAHDLLPQDNGATDGNGAFTLHLCEAPGAFICATNHYVKTERPDWNWEWKAVSLNPAFEGNDRNAMIDDDVLIQATSGNWCFGQDNSGDIRDPRNISYIWNECRNICNQLGIAGAMLVTADGSVDCQEDPNEQERATAPLHFCELVAGLGMLAPGGCMVLKAFTLLEHPSLCCLRIMAAAFDTLLVTKPSCSKPGNSETYLVGKGFRGVPPDLLEALLACVSKNDMFATRALLPEHEVAGSFLLQAIECGRFFANEQRDVIEENLSLFSGYSGMPRHIREQFNMEKEWLSHQWASYCHMKRLDMPGFLSKRRLDGRNNNTGGGGGGGRRDRKPSGTLADRQQWYAKRREIQGNCSSEARSTAPVASRFRPADNQKEERAIAAARTYAQTPATYSNAAQAMMRKMGHETGKGLGRDSAGISSPIEAGPMLGRQGLGFSQTPLAALEPASDRKNGMSKQFWHADGTPATASAPLPTPEPRALANEAGKLQKEDVQHWKVDITPGLPPSIKGSKFLLDDVLMRLKDARLQACAHCQTHHSDSGHHSVCQHSGTVCRAPRSQSQQMETDEGVQQKRTRSWWKMAGLDSMLRLREQLASLSSPAGSQQSPVMLPVLDLGQTDAAQYLVDTASGKLNVSLLPNKLKEVPSPPTMSMPALKVHHAALDHSGSGQSTPTAYSPGSIRNSPFLQAALATPTYTGSMDSTVHHHDVHATDSDALPNRPGHSEMKQLQYCLDIARAAKASHVQLVIGDLCNLRKLSSGRQAELTTALLSAGTARKAQDDASTLTTDKDVLGIELCASYRRAVLWEACCALHSLSKGGSAILRLADCLTTFSASLLYVMYRSFEKVILCKPPTSCASSNERLLCCFGRLEDDGAPAHLLQTVLQAQESCCPNGTSTTAYITSFVPYEHLTSKAFLTYLADRNRELSMHEACASMASLGSSRQESDQGQQGQMHVLDEAQKAWIKHAQTWQPSDAAALSQVPMPSDINRHVSGSSYPDTDMHTPMSVASGPVTWQGLLMVRSAKGLEPVCTVRADAWPAPLKGADMLIVEDYCILSQMANSLACSTPTTSLAAVSADAALDTPLQPNATDAGSLQSQTALGRFLAYCAGHRPSGRVIDAKVAIATAQFGNVTRKFYLVPAVPLDCLVATPPGWSKPLPPSEAALAEAGMQAYMVSK